MSTDDKDRWDLYLCRVVEAGFIKRRRFNGRVCGPESSMLDVFRPMWNWPGAHWTYGVMSRYSDDRTRVVLRVLPVCENCGEKVK